MGRSLHASTAAALGAVLFLCNPPGVPEPTAGVRATATPGACPGRAIKPTQVITGAFGPEQARSFVMLPFDVPAGTTAVRVKYCFDQPDIPISTPLVSARHTLDLGLYGPRKDPNGPWGMDEFRGWGGSSHPDVTVSAEGFSSEAQYLARPRVDPAGKTTRAFRPGPIEPGRWAVELGVAAVVARALGDLDGKVAWRVEIELASDARFADEPYRPAPYDSTPARRAAGWYAGDMHVHADQSALGDATMRETFDYAFKPLAQGGAGLDFITLSDYVSGGSWGEIGRHQPAYPGKQVIRSAEVITYRGHLNNHNSAKVVDYREGPIYERRADGSLVQLRGPRSPARTFDDIHGAGGYTQINHPTIFPSQVPLFDLFCRGCPWDYTAAATDYSKVDAIELATGPSKLALDGTPNPFTVTALQFYERALATGAKIAAVGVSDSHRAGRVSNPVTSAPIGTATTVVRAEELSEPGIECGVEARHTYVKVTGNKAPDLRFEARPAGWSGAPAIMGDTVRASSATFTARVIGGAGRELHVYRGPRVVRTIAVSGDDFSTTFEASDFGHYRLQLQDGLSIEAASSPIWLESGTGGVITRDCTPLSVRGKAKRRIRPGRRGRFLTRCAVSGAGAKRCVVTVVRRGRRLGAGRVAIERGSRRVRVKLNRSGRRAARKQRRVRLVFTVDDGDGASAAAVRRARLLAR